MTPSPRLPPLDWLTRPEAQAVFSALSADAGETRLVGGVVRDALVGRPSADHDLATRLTPDNVLERARGHGLKAVPTGIGHGTVTLLSGGMSFEVTTLRRDVATDGRHAVVAFSLDWAEDAGRRDFTINALFADPLTGAIYDYTGGLADLAQRRVRFIGSADRRIEEDHLRILRFFRFHARYGGDAPDAEGLTACIAARRSLMALSRERIRDELLKLLVAPRAVATLGIMLANQILAPVLPELAAERLPDLARLADIESALGRVDPLRRLAALLPPDARVNANIGARLKLSRAEQERLIAMAGRLAALPADPQAAKRWAWPLPVATAVDRLLLAAPDIASVAQMLAALDAWERPRLPVSGRDLIAAGLPPGPEISQALHRLETAWIAADFPTEVAIDREPGPSPPKEQA